MNIYFSGIGGVALGPLAEIARDAGHTVIGSDASRSLVTERLTASDIDISTDQSGNFLATCHEATPIDWLVYTSALPDDHPELVWAREHGIARVTKRNELIDYIVQEKNLTLIAIAGTHGKTTTTAMMVWVFQQLGIPVSYSVGTTLNFGTSGKYMHGSTYFLYECDEFDRNFLHFSPALSLITTIDYDHPDTYPSPADYNAAFTQFLSQSGQVIMWAHDSTNASTVPANAWLLRDEEIAKVGLAGSHNRANATLVLKACQYLSLGDGATITAALGDFPGSDRRFERLAENLYTDYGHHPKEIAATLQLARELSDHIVLVYQPHQNTRQHQIRDDYSDSLALAEQVYWLPTYLTREDSSLPLLSPEELTSGLHNRESVLYADLNDELWHHIETARREGKLVICMGAGTIDSWLRDKLHNQ